MKAHELARELLKCNNFEVAASIDISTCDADSDRRIFTTETIGINAYNVSDGREIIILFSADPIDNYGVKL
jgi:hypothetical protein